MNMNDYSRKQKNYTTIGSINIENESLKTLTQWTIELAQAQALTFHWRAMKVLDAYVKAVTLIGNQRVYGVEVELKATLNNYIERRLTDLFLCKRRLDSILPNWDYSPLLPDDAKRLAKRISLRSRMQINLLLQRKAKRNGCATIPLL